MFRLVLILSIALGAFACADHPGIKDELKDYISSDHIAPSPSEFYYTQFQAKPQPTAYISYLGQSLRYHAGDPVTKHYEIVSIDPKKVIILDIKTSSKHTLWHRGHTRKVVVIK